MYLKNCYSWPKVPTVFLFQALCTSLLPLQQSLPLHLDQLVLWLAATSIQNRQSAHWAICSLVSHSSLLNTFLPPSSRRALILLDTSNALAFLPVSSPSMIICFRCAFTISVKHVAFRDVFNAHPLEIWQVGSYLDVCVWKLFLFVCNSPRPLCTFRSISSLHGRRSILSLI